MVHRIEKIEQHGVMSVYLRCWSDGSNLPKYVIIREPDGKVLEDFRRLSSARKWAKDNQNG